MTGNPARAHLTTADGRRLSYLDFGSATGRPLLALHGHVMEGACFGPLAAALGDEWRVIAPDQRGHGDSDRAGAYDREGYLADLVALVEHLGIAPCVVLGHSLGGINAYHLAARRPELVSALINVDAAVDIPAASPGPPDCLRSMPYTAGSRAELLAPAGPLVPLIEDALRPHGDGWRLPFHPDDILESDRQVRGDHLADWMRSDCPGLLIHGRRSQVLSGVQAQSMVTLRPNTRLTELDTDHFVPLEDPRGFERAVRDFLTAFAAV